MSLAFPSSPNPGESFVASNGYTYRWDGFKWNTVIGGVSNLLKLYQTEEAVGFVSTSTPVVAYDCLTQNIFYHKNIANDFIVDLTNFGLESGYGTAVTIILEQGTTGYRITEYRINGSTSTIFWAAGIEPEPSSNTKDIQSLSIINDNGTYVVMGQQLSFG
jgi:hypothetical protein